MPHYSISDKVWYMKDGVNKNRTLIDIILNPSQIQFLYILRCDNNKVLETTCKFLKFKVDEEVSKIPLITEGYI